MTLAIPSPWILFTITPPIASHPPASTIVIVFSLHTIVTATTAIAIKAITIVKNPCYKVFQCCLQEGVMTLDDDRNTKATEGENYIY
jgi:hypothetical protein